nr:hypothetical protein [Bacteroidota bacterium]
MNQQLLLNIIPFTAPIREAEFAFYKTWQEGYCPISKDDLKGAIEDEIKDEDFDEGNWLYTDFLPAKENAIPLNIDLTKCTRFAQHYYRHLIRQYFIGVADVWRNNFTNEVEVWILNPKAGSDTYKVYNQFTLKVQHSRITEGPELVLSYDGKTKVYNTSLKDMVNFETDNYNWINCDGELHRYKYLPDRHKLNLDKLFPVLSNRLKPHLGIAFDIPDFSNRYPRYRKTLQEFYDTFLNTEAFKNIIPISPDGFYKANGTSVQRISDASNELLFGKGVGKEPKTDMKKLGPCKPVPPPNNVRFFFIYQSNQRQQVAKLYNFFIEGFKQEGYAYPAFPNMQDFIHQKFSINKEDSITFESLAVAAQIVEKAIKNKEKLPDTKYMAIYISPVSKINATPQNKNVYYRIKETLLQHSITSQVIYTDNISKSDFKYYLPNIEIAILAKLGGIPWRLNRTTNNELIVGIGAFYSTTFKSRFVGSAFCFNNEGNFKGFDCFGANDTDMLAGSIREAVGKFIASNYKATRLIIHFYKDLSKKELKPILDTLRALGLGIPVIVVTINKTESKELLAFDTSSPNLMPYSGTIVKIGWQEYLLFNNTRYDEASQPSKKEYHFPVKLSFFVLRKGC